jgi:glucose/arabinose dehydrogenase
VPPVRRLPLLLALVAGVLVAVLQGHGASSAAGATLAQVGDFNRPVYVMAPPRDTRNVFVVERGGTVRLLVDGALRPRPFLDIRSLVSTSSSRENERGLLSIAFAPDYTVSGRFYVYYTSIAGNGDIAVDEFRRSATDAEVADPATRRTLLTVEHSAYANHNGGQLAFGPDGALYAGTGDGGGAGDPLRSGQSSGSFLGKLLRLDPIGGGATSVWSMGLRNPFRFSFDRLTGDLTVGDVGQSNVEEIDFVSKAAGWGRGANFGWNILEGTQRYGAGRAARADEHPAGYVGPVIEHGHSAGWCSITGGYVVRDSALPELYGRYVYGDYCRGELWAANVTPQSSSRVGSSGLRVSGLSSLGEDGCGRIYAASIDGPVYRLAQGGACAGPAPVPFAVPVEGPVGSAPRDRRRPKVKLKVPQRQKVLRQGYLRLRVGCNELCRVRVAGKVLGPVRGVTLQATLHQVRRTLAPNARVNVRLPIALPARRQLAARFRKHPLWLARVTVVARDATDNRRVTKTLAILSR